MAETNLVIFKNQGISLSKAVEDQGLFVRISLGFFGWQLWKYLEIDGIDELVKREVC